jgi:phosphoribosylanthranilate isomerase
VIVNPDENSSSEVLVVRVKICGITNSDDAHMAVEAGADALGFVFFDRSPRCVTPTQAAAIIETLPPFVQAVGLFVNADPVHVNATAEQCRLDLVQLHGDESPDYCSAISRRVLKAFRVKDPGSLSRMQEYRVAGYLLDAWSPVAYGGTGHTFDWDLGWDGGGSGLPILAGGLTPDNIADAVMRVRPFAVDVSSGVESAPGHKDARAVLEFIRMAKEAIR